MLVNLVSRDNGVGLSTDMDLLSGILTDAGHDVTRVNWRSSQMRRCDAAIFLELYNPRLTRFARATVGVFNLEWFLVAWRSHLSGFTQLWAKSGEAFDRYRQWGVVGNATLTGFASRDLYAPDVPRELRVLHVQGKSTFKGTTTVLEAWRRHDDLPPLTLVSHMRHQRVPPNVRVVGRLPYDALAREMNGHAVHVCPSVNEGWGHYISEGLSTGAVVVTTDASPMNEHVRPDWGFLIPATDHPVKRGAYVEHRTTPDGLADAVRQAAALDDTARAQMSELARAHCARRTRRFRLAALRLLDRLG